MSNLVEFARKELERAGWFASDSSYDGDIGKAVVELVETFSKQGHSGASAKITVALLTRLLDWQPISPLTGADDEWRELGDDNYQNKRCSSVFKESGKAYHMDAVVYVRSDGSTYTKPDSNKVIEFPYYPEIEYVYEKG